LEEVVLRIKLATLLLLGLTSLAGASEYASTSVEMNLEKVAEHSYYAQGVAGTATENEGFISNAGVIITPEGLVIVDALGTPSLATKLLELIREVSQLPIKYVVVTHYHADHIYGLQVFKDEGARIIAPAGADDYLNSPNAEERLDERRVSLFPWVDENTRLVFPDEYISDSKSLKLGGVELVVSYLGDAHSEGDLSVYVVPDRVLYSGDIIFEGRVPFVGSANTKNWLETLEKLETDNLQYLIPGHGPAAENPQQTIVLTREYLQLLRKTMGAAVEEFVPFDEAYADADWSAFEMMPAFEEANRRNAYQVYLGIEAETLGQ
jgi:glyoxylase-like metal-dependent hydrolase (beta-lactamase superfamily II)